jgi:transcriptional regulator with PAS, ATPase and Fis domain
MRTDDRTRTLLAPNPEVLARPRLLAIWEAGAAFCSLREGVEAIVGRAVDCALRINDPSVSRQHAAVKLDEQGDAFIRDLGSANGTRVGGRRLQGEETRRLLPGDAAAVGTVVLVLQEGLARPVSPRFGSAPREASAAGELARLVEQVARGDLPIVLAGETGVGKEVTAERIHRLSPRAGRAFLKLNCAALSDSLLESELFGHERGAFTGAVAAKPGLLESADGGTVLLDEVTELTPAIQAKLLRALENQEILRVGGLKTRKIDVRFVSATNRDFAALVRRGGFRADLYYRLNGLTIRLPPLRERRDEIRPLAEGFLTEAARKLGKPAPDLSAAALAALREHGWPGNIRELRNVMQRAALLSSEGVVEPRDLVLETEEVATPGSAGPSTLEDEMAALERQRIVAALDESRGNQTLAARRLGLSRKVLMNRLDLHGLPRPRKHR